MATLEQVCTELYNLNGLNDLQLETQLEIHQGIGEMSDAIGETNQHLIDIKKVLDNFVNAVPEQIIHGFEKVIVDDRLADQKQSQTNEKLKDREGGKKSESGIAGAFARGRNDFNPDKNLKKLFGGLTDIIENTLESIGMMSMALQLFGGKIKPFFKWALSMLGMAGNTLLAALSGLVSAIFSPIGAIAAGIAAVGIGIYKAVQGFLNFNGDIVDKLIEGVQNFIDGVLMVVTVPLDWILNATAWLLDAIGFDSIAEVLRDFSVTDLVDSITDSIANLFMGIKDWIVEKIMGIAAPILRFLGFDEAALTAEVTADSYANKDNDKLREEADARSEEDQQESMGKIKGSLGMSDSEQEKEKQGREAADEAIQRVAQIQEEAQADTKRIRQDAKTQAEAARVGPNGQPYKVPAGTPSVGAAAQPQVIGAAPMTMGSGANSMTVNEAGSTYSSRDLTFVSTNNTSVRVPRPQSRSMTTREVLEERATDRIDRIVTGYETDASTKITTMINDKSPIKVSQGDVSEVLSSVTNSEGGFLSSTVNTAGSFISSIFGGDQSTANQTSEMMARTDQLNDNRATANTTNGGSVAVVDNSSQNSTTVNNMSLSGTPTAIDRSDRTHIGNKFGRGGQ